MVECGVMNRSAEEAARHLASYGSVDCVALALSPPRAGRAGSECSLCEAALSGHPPPRVTDALHQFAAYQSERLGGRYIYVCPYALLHVAAPVLLDDRLESVLVSGPAVLGGADEEIIRAIRASRLGSLISEDAVVAWVASLPRLAPDEATSLSDILARVALSCCDQQGAQHLQENRPQDTAPELSDYLGYLRSMEGDKRSTMRYPVERERELLDYVAAGDRHGAERVLRQLVIAVNGLEASRVEEARSRVLELVVLLSRAAIAGGADVELVFGLEYRSLSRLRELSSLDEISAWLSRILTRFVDLVFDLRHVRYSAHLSRVLAYLRENFREPITLSQVAGAVDLSPGYLGRIFRSELRSSFSRYLQRLRIQEAKRLLKKSSMPVGDVGVASGFSDHSYFSQVFRKETGVSPREYRQKPVA